MRAPSIASDSGNASAAPEPAHWASAHFSVPPSSGDSAVARRQAARLDQLAGVRSVTLNPICGTLHVCYDGANLTLAELRRCSRQDARGARSSGCAERTVDALRWAPLLARVVRALLGGASG